MKIKTEVVVVVVVGERERERDEFLFSQNFRGLIMISLVFPPTHTNARSPTYFETIDDDEQNLLRGIFVLKKKDR